MEATVFAILRKPESWKTGFCAGVIFRGGKSALHRYPWVDMQWYYSKNGTQLGPVTEADLMAKLASREVLPTDLVWKDGMGNWLPASNVPELALMSAFPTAKPGIPSTVNSPYSTPVHSPAYVGGVMAPPTSGLAIASLICGILGLVTCLFLPSIPAVICGHMALSRMAQPGVLLGGRGMAIAGLVMGYLAIVCMLGFFVVIALGGMAGSLD